MMDTDHGIFNSMIGQGWTLVGISGDWGATAGCDSHDAVSYPGSDPDMVSAGGTSLALGLGGAYDQEQAWIGTNCAINDGGSGGGSSAYYAAPSYMGLPTGIMRPVPDIALNADAIGHHRFIISERSRRAAANLHLLAAPASWRPK